MSETQQTTQPAAPAAPAAQATAAKPNQAKAQMADLDALVPIKVNGREELVPVRALAVEGQTFEAGKRALADAQRIREEAKRYESDAETWRNFQAGLARDPDGTVQSVTRLANLAKGAPVRTGVTPRGDTSSSDSDDDDVPVQNQDVDRRLRLLEVGQHQTALSTEINEMLTLFPALAANEEIRSMAQMTMQAARAADPNASLHRVAATLHTGLQKLAGGVLTTQRDDRLQRTHDLPVTPAGGGAPSPIEVPKMTRDSLKNGEHDTALQSAWEAWQRSLKSV